jgi:hypothetical protein
VARQNPDEDRPAHAAEADGQPGSGVSRADQGAQPDRSRPDQAEIRETIQQWKRVARSLDRQQDTDPVRRWVRARSIDLAIRSVETIDVGRENADDLAALGDQVTGLLKDLEPRIDPAVRRDIETWLDLRRDRDALDRRLSEASSRLHKTFEERSHHRVHEWFAQDMPVAVLATEPLPAVTTEAEAHASLERAQQAAAAAQAQCPPRPSKGTQEIVSEWPWDPAVNRVQDRPLDPAVADREADEARRALAALPPAGNQPMWLYASDIPFAYKWLHRAWSLAVFTAPIATLVALTGLAMKGPNTEDTGFWHRMQATAVITWAVVGGGWLVERLVDSYLTKNHAAWVARSTPLDRARRAIGWQYLLRQAEAEQREAEADGLRDLIGATARLRDFDQDPDLGRQLVAVRDRHPDLSAHVDAAAADLKWASGKA